MGWKLYVFGADPIEDEIVSRRFGPSFNKPCQQPSMLECARRECQDANECTHKPTEQEKYEGALSLQRGLPKA